MVYILSRLIINAAALLVVVNIIPGINIPSWGTLLAAVIVIGLLNAFLKPLLVLFTLPINILTLGLFTLFINAFIFYLTSELIKEFRVNGFWEAFFGALVFSIISVLLNFVLTKSGKTNKTDGNKET